MTKNVFWGCCFYECAAAQEILAVPGIHICFKIKRFMVFFKILFPKCIVFYQDRYWGQGGTGAGLEVG